MAEKIIVLTILYCSMFLYDIPKLKETRRPERITYSILILITAYLGLGYILDDHWPNLTIILDLIFSGPAKLIEAYFKQ